MKPSNPRRICRPDEYSVNTTVSLASMPKRRLTQQENDGSFGDWCEIVVMNGISVQVRVCRQKHERANSRQG
jgi:hypothetical protein